MAEQVSPAIWNMINGRDLQYYENLLKGKHIGVSPRAFTDAVKGIPGKIVDVKTVPGYNKAVTLATTDDGQQYYVATPHYQDKMQYYIHDWNDKWNNPIDYDASSGAGLGVGWAKKEDVPTLPKLRSDDISDGLGYGLGGLFEAAGPLLAAYSGYNLLGGGGIGDLFSGLGDTTSDILAGEAAGGTGMDLFSGLGDTIADLGAGTDFSASDFLNLTNDFAIDDKIQVLTNMGIPENIATQIGPSLSNGALQGLMGLGTNGLGLVKSLLTGGGSSSDLTSLLGMLTGNNMLANSTSDIVGDWLDEIKASGAFTPEQQKALAERAVDLSARDYLDPNFDQLFSEYTDRGQQADRFGANLEQLYSNPLGMDVYNALAGKNLQDMLRIQGAKGRLQGGNLESDTFNSRVKSMLELASPMNQSWQTAIQGQNAPINMINALDNADKTAWGGAATLGNLANQEQQALSNFITNVAAPAELSTNPVGRGLQTLYGRTY